MITLAGKVALVTGASRGIGRATALLLARCGADVALACHARRAEAEAAAGEIRALGRRAVVEAGDLGDPAAAERIVDSAARSLGALDLFVGNAGVWPPEEVPLRDLAPERWRATMQANLDAIYYSTRAALRRMRPGGRVVLVSSTAGQRGEAFHADYAATKGAIIALVKSLCIECAPDITVNCVAPGWVDTEMSRPAFGDGGYERIAATIPLRRIATADDVAGPIVFLCSDLARHITGEVLNVNGGSVLCG
ncbi:MAG TPA: SDR family NAD(P)-dependent oxidoreductase [Gemmatimonadales bacterium]|nr:SDR family NAD(P)-dependent oxidoreductase [Gemmatimonadales bacterium]